MMIDIKNHLRNYGYYLEYSLNDDLCSKELRKYLGRKKYDKFWTHVDNMVSLLGTNDVEKIIRDFIGEDLKFLKILLSGQIIISVSIIEEIINSIKRNSSFLNKKLDILELGGYDGWTSDYLDLSIENELNLDVVDFEKSKNNPNKNIQLINSDYKDFLSKKKYDIVFSVLGINYNNINILLNCVLQNINKGGYVYLGLRVQPDNYDSVNNKLINLGFTKVDENLKIVTVNKDTGQEHFPLFQYKKV